ncbi:MAG: hypothetical protein GC191_19075 [Azospirillum sp.]|nr:hypothetical protein [Azospirillum sp.]
MSRDTAAADALRLLALLERPFEADTAAALDRLIQPYQRRMPQLAATERYHGQADPAGRTPDALLRRRIAQTIVLFLIPALRQRLLDPLPAGPGPSAPDCAGVLAGLVAWLTDRYDGPASTEHLRGLAGDLVTAAEQLASTAGGRLDRDDTPDLADLAQTLLRLETLGWLLEELGDHRGPATLAGHRRRLAAAAFGRIEAVVGRFLDQPDQLTLFDSAAVIAPTDAVVVVASQLAGAPVAAAPDAADSAAALGSLAARLMQLADRLQAFAFGRIGRVGSNRDYFRALLRQLDCLVRIGRGSAGTPATPLHDLAVCADAHLRGLAQAVAVAQARLLPDRTTRSLLNDQAHDIAAVLDRSAD